MKTNSWRAKPKTYRQAPTHWLKFYEEAFIEFEAQTAVVQLKREGQPSTMTGLTTRHAVSRIILFRPGSFRLGSFRPWVVSTNFGGSFRSNFFKSPPPTPPRLRIIGRTIIWLFDEESSEVKGLLLSPFRLEVIDRTLMWLFDEESSDVKGLF